METQSIDILFGKRGKGLMKLSEAAQSFLNNKSTAELLSLTGKTIESLPVAVHFDNTFIQESSRKSNDHFVAGKGLFFITESRKLVLDCTSGHYQMPWGYQPDDIAQTIADAMRHGVTWDCHSDIPGNPVKALSYELVALANGFESFDDSRMQGLDGRDDVLNRVIMSGCTGTVACAAAFRMAYVYYMKVRSQLGAPVFITFVNNYHGTDTFAQSMRGMWPGLFDKNSVEFVQVPPNDIKAIEGVFSKYGKRVACFFMELVMMNNEALLITRETVQKVRELTRKSDAMLVVDEIQSCFFVPELMMFRQYDITPDAVIVGKGMTAGFHGQAACIFRKKFDVLEQFDALSTNGNAPLAAVAALACIDKIKKNKLHLQKMQERFFSEMESVAREFSGLIQGPMGKGLLAGFKFHSRDMALKARSMLLENGLWVRVHAYKPDHRTLLVKFALVIDEKVMDYFFSKVREVFGELDKQRQDLGKR